MSLYSPLYLKNKVALVSGASRGIGRAIALSLGKQGANLILIARQSVPLNAVQKEVENLGVSCQTIACDVAEHTKLMPLLDQALAKLDTIDILVNNAGIFKSEPVRNHSEKTWEETLSINLSSAFYLSRYVLEKMIAKNWGRILNISSVSGQAGEPYGAAYSASKFGMLGLTQSLALEVAPFGITVNAICPGWVATQMASEQLSDPKWCKLNELDPSQALEITRLSVPQQRFIEPEEVADLALFLCSNQAKGITGQSINICGGLSV